MRNFIWGYEARFVRETLFFFAEDTDGVLAGALRIVECVIRIRDQIFGRAAVPVLCDSDTDACLAGIPQGFKNLTGLHESQNLLRDVQSPLRARSRKNHAEFVTAAAEHQICSTDARVQDAANLDQQLVADKVSV